MYVLVDKSKDSDMPDMYLTSTTVQPVADEFELTQDVTQAMQFKTSGGAQEMCNILDFGFVVEEVDSE